MTGHGVVMVGIALGAALAGAFLGVYLGVCSLIKDTGDVY